MIDKETAKLILLAKGFSKKEIIEDYIFKFKTGKQRKIDVVGINKNKKIAIVIGIPAEGSIEELEGYFDRVFNLSLIADNDKIIKNIIKKLVAIDERIIKIKDFNNKLEEYLNTLFPHFKFLLDFYKETTGNDYFKNNFDVNNIEFDKNSIISVVNNLDDIKRNLRKLILSELKDRKLEDLIIEEDKKVVKLLEELEKHVDEKEDSDNEEDSSDDKQDEKEDVKNLVDDSETQDKLIEEISNLI